MRSWIGFIRAFGPVVMIVQETISASSALGTVKEITNDADVLCRLL